MANPKFKEGHRVLYRCPENPDFPSAPKFSSMGNAPYVMHLNARDEEGQIKPITGVILRVARPDSDGTINYDFRPDKWLLPMGSWPAGFQVPEWQLIELTDPELVLEGTITDRQGRPQK